jgi:hypothetical protein
MFHHPFTMIVAGPSLIGKSTLVHKLVCNADSLVWHEDGHSGFDVIFVLYKSFQPLYREMQQQLPVYLFERSLPTDLNSLLEKTNAKRPLLIIDDGIDQQNQDLVSDLFTRLSHHLNLSVILITQTIFDSRQPALRLCHRNAKYLILFPCIRDVHMLRNLIYQMNSDKKKAQQIMTAIEKEFSVPHGYVLLDMHPLTPSALRYKTQIFDRYPIVLAFPEDIKGPATPHIASFQNEEARAQEGKKSAHSHPQYNIQERSVFAQSLSDSSRRIV